MSDGFETSLISCEDGFAEDDYSATTAVISLHLEADHLISLYKAGHLADVITKSEALLRRFPQDAQMFNILGAACIGLKEFAKAEAAYSRAAGLDPADCEIHNNHGIALASLGRVNDAISAFDRALALHPDYAEAWYNLGNALRKRQATAAAIEAYARVLALRPDYVDAWNNLGLAYQEHGERDEALACYSQALAIRPDALDALHNLGHLLTELENYEGAIKTYGLALAIAPDRMEILGHQLYARAHICDFSAHEDYRQLSESEALKPGNVSPFVMLVLQDDPERQLAYSRACPAATGEHPPLKAQPKSPGERIRIGYFSADFHDHATLCLMAGLFREHDRQRFEIIAYSYGPERESAMRAQLIEHVDRFIDVRDMPDSQIVESARNAALDIAIDLKGYTQHSRSRLFIHRMAPIQINYLGYPGSLGGDFIDYLIADPVVIPEAARGFHDEKIITLPGSYQPNDDARPIIDDGGTRADHGLPEAAFVFCCFNQACKIGPREFDIWMRLLCRVDGSVLWLLRTNQWAEHNLRKEAAARGVDPQRLVFAERLPHAEHLGRLKHADLFLDTFHYNAHTTASDALWAGLPVLTKAGRQFAARVGASLVTAVGLPELIARSETEYEALALALATNPASLSKLRSRLARNRLTHPLFDTRLYARQIEAAYETIHQRHVAGLPPDHLSL